MEYYSAVKKEILSFPTTSMGLENIMLSKIRQVQKDKYAIVSFICVINKNQKRGSWGGGREEWRDVGQTTESSRYEQV